MLEIGGASETVLVGISAVKNADSSETSKNHVAAGACDGIRHSHAAWFLLMPGGCLPASARRASVFA